MNLNYLDFEQPIAELQKKIEELRFATSGSEGEAGNAEAPVELRPAERPAMDGRAGLRHQGWFGATL